MKPIRLTIWFSIETQAQNDSDRKAAVEDLLLQASPYLTKKPDDIETSAYGFTLTYLLSATDKVQAMSLAKDIEKQVIDHIGQRMKGRASISIEDDKGGN